MPNIAKNWKIMNTTVPIHSSKYLSFRHYIWKVRANRKCLLWAGGLSIFQLLIFKYFYPYPDFISDSYSYIFGAVRNLDVNIWPIGYSKFLLLIHHITHSDIALVAIQYFFLELSALYLFFTIRYFYSLSQTSNAILFSFLFCNPMYLYLCNLVNSDSLFAALSLLWLSQLILVINRPNIYQVFVQAILLFLCFTVRNTAYYYPIISAISFMLSNQKMWKKITGIISPLLFMVPFIIHTRNESYKITGTHQFSLFTGWQLSNNALYGYDYMHVDTTKLPTIESKELNVLVREFYKHVPNNFHSVLFDYEGNYFIIHPNTPLKQYMERHYDLTDDYNIVQSWGRSSVIFSEYGKLLIKQNPLSYFKGFVLPNTTDYFLPPLNNFKLYNRGKDEIWTIAQDWFDWQTPRLTVASKGVQRYILYIYPYLFLFLNVYILLALILLAFRKRLLKENKSVARLLILTLSFLTVNFWFTVFVAMNIFRYQFIPMATCLVSALLLTELLEKKALSKLDNFTSQKVNHLSDSISVI